MTGILGSGEYRYEPAPDWAKVPPELILGDVAGIAVDARDRVYLFNRGDAPVVVQSENGEVLTAGGHGLSKKLKPGDPAPT